MRGLVVITTVVTIVALGFLLPAYGDTVESRIAKLEAQVATLQSQVQLFTLTTNRALETIDSLESQVEALKANPKTSLKIAYLNAEDAFSVFTDAVSNLRQKAIDKQMEIAKLQQDFMAGTISKDEYQNTNNIDVGTIDKMINSPGFSNMRSDLQRLRGEAQPVIDEMKNLVTTIRTGVIDTQEFENRYTQVKNAFTQLDQLLTQAATAKIVEAANKVALAEGYDLVLRVKNVIIYRNNAKLVDITDLVKIELAGYL
jgi:Skp family chaperone for outer membrane proteins